MNAPSSVDWDDLRVLLTVARRGSVRAAARSLRVSHTTISRRISKLEEGLGARVLERNGAGRLAPTLAGAELLQAAEEAEVRLDEAQRRIQGRDARLSGVLRVSVFESVIESFFLHHIMAFHKAHPDIELELIDTNERVSLTRREADIALRYAVTSPPSGLIGRRIGHARYGLYAARAFRAQAEAENAGPLKVLCYTDQPVTLNDEAWLRKAYPNTVAGLRTNTASAMCALGRAGPGLCRLPCFLGDTVPELVRLQLDPTDWGHDVWLLTHPDLRRTARVAAFMSFVGERLLADRDLIEGRRPLWHGPDDAGTAKPTGDTGSFSHQIQTRGARG